MVCFFLNLDCHISGQFIAIVIVTSKAAVLSIKSEEGRNATLTERQATPAAGKAKE